MDFILLKQPGSQLGHLLAQIAPNGVFLLDLSSSYWQRKYCSSYWYNRALASPLPFLSCLQVAILLAAVLFIIAFICYQHFIGSH